MWTGFRSITSNLVLHVAIASVCEVSLYVVRILRQRLMRKQSILDWKCKTLTSPFDRAKEGIVLAEKFPFIAVSLKRHPGVDVL